MGGGAFVVGRDGQEKEVECGVGDLVTVWDGEVAGTAEVYHGEEEFWYWPIPKQP